MFVAIAFRSKCRVLLVAPARLVDRQGLRGGVQVGTSGYTLEFGYANGQTQPRTKVLRADVGSRMAILFHDSSPGRSRPSSTEEYKAPRVIEGGA